MDGVFRETGGEVYKPEAANSPPRHDCRSSIAHSSRRAGVPIPKDWQRPAPDAWNTESVRLAPLTDGDALLILSGWLSGSGDDPWEELAIMRWLRFDAAANVWLEVGEPFLRLIDQEGRSTTFGLPHPDGFAAALSDGRVLFAGGRAVAGGRADATRGSGPRPDVGGLVVAAEAPRRQDGGRRRYADRRFGPRHGVAHRKRQALKRAFRFIPAR